VRYLIDTCVIYELARTTPSQSVRAWATENDEGSLYLSVLTFGELHKGIARLKPSRKKERLHQWVEHDLKERFRTRVLDIDSRVAKVWGEIQGRSEVKGRPMPAIDSLIAATGVAHDLTVVTRNTADMQQSGVSLLNPWEERPR
jgi:predicted nucleic acid-binding protein